MRLFIFMLKKYPEHSKQRLCFRPPALAPGTEYMKDIKQRKSRLLQVPRTQYRAEPQSPAAAMLYTGEDQTVSAAVANNLFVENTLTSAAVAAPIANFQRQAAQVTQTLQCNQ